MIPAPESLGFVGLGEMGSRMVAALIGSGRTPVVFDTRAEAVDDAVALGAERAGSVAEVAARAATVMVSLPTPDIVRAVAHGDGGLIEGGAMSTFVDLSTTGLGNARELAALLSERDISYLDAPVSGGVAGAEKRALAVFAAGSDEVFERCRGLLEPFSKVVLRVGEEPGLGQLAKLLNNLLSATAVTITSEAMAVGVRAGLDPAALLEAFNSGSGRNSATQEKFPNQVVNRHFESGFRLALMLKDVRLALAEAAALGIAMPLGGLVEQLWTLADNVAGDGADHTEVARVYERWADVEIVAREESPRDVG